MAKIGRSECPHCRKKVFQLPRHVRYVHGYSADKARHVNLKFNLRKSTKRLNDTKYVYYHKRSKCHVKGCIAVIRRIDIHLKKEHRLSAFQQLALFGSNIKLHKDQFWLRNWILGKRTSSEFKRTL